MTGTAERRSDRISVEVAVEIMGTDVSGEYFTAKAETLLLSRHGAAILVNRRLAPTQEMVIRHLAANRETECRVVGQIEQREVGYVYGIAFLDPNVDFWGIVFPSRPAPEEAVGRALLQCGGCRGRHVTYLNEFELEVFQANRVITLYCKRCRDSTLWREAEYETSGKAGVGRLPVRSSGGVDEGPEDPDVLRVDEEPRTENERKHLRVRTTINACIRRAGSEEEEVRTENVSRGGFCFQSRKVYELGTKIEVALPYLADSANIFVPARIVRIRPLHAAEETQYGVSYGHVP